MFLKCLKYVCMKYQNILEVYIDINPITWEQGYISQVNINFTELWFNSGEKDIPHIECKIQFTASNTKHAGYFVQDDHSVFHFRILYYIVLTLPTFCLINNSDSCTELSVLMFFLKKRNSKCFCKYTVSI